MSRKNRNARRQANKPLNPHAVQMAMDTSPAADKNCAAVRMLDEKCGYEFTRLPSIMLESDTSYQRPIDLKRVQRIVENFDARLVNPLKVSEREGHYYVFDGAHTLAALKEIKKFDNFMVDVMLFHGLAYEDEAYLFALQRGADKLCRLRAGNRLLRSRRAVRERGDHALFGGIAHRGRVRRRVCVRRVRGRRKVCRSG